MTFQEWWAQVWEMLIGRAWGQGHVRVIVQPTVAVVFAVRAALRDAREGRPPYFFWSVFTNPALRPELLRQLWRDVGKVFIAAAVVDMIYELIVYRWIYPGQALVVAAMLALVPYLVLRGPVTRILRRLRRV